MTYHSDPTRWTQSPGEAPELLRGGLEAAGREGPSELQMRTLALKLAAVGTGAALAAGAAGAKASTTAAGAGAGLAATGTSLMTKVVVSVALIGAAATSGTVLLRQPSHEAQREAVVATSPSPPQQVVAPQINPGLPVVTPKEPSAQASTSADAVRAHRASAVQQPSAAARPVEAEHERTLTPSAAALEREAPAAAEAPDSSNRAERRERRHARAPVAEREQPAREPVNADAMGAKNVPKIAQVTGEKPQLSEIDLLTKARSALAARPREAYRLTEEHRDLYPSGVFAQERDALAVEALLRAGDAKRARERAEAFLARYPSSPAAHRFRETLNLP